jgi:hypothetical protein
MTAFEICQEYRQAKNKNAQIQILADQNECSKQEIITMGGITMNNLQMDDRVLEMSNNVERAKMIMQEIIEVYFNGCDPALRADRGMAACWEFARHNIKADIVFDYLCLLDAQIKSVLGELRTERKGNGNGIQTDGREQDRDQQ